MEPIPMHLTDVVELNNYPITDPAYIKTCKERFDEGGVLVLDQFISPQALSRIVEEGVRKKDKAYFAQGTHTVYQLPVDPELPLDHARNRQVVSSKGLIADNVIDADSPLRTLYDAPEFREFLAQILGEEKLYNYADDVGSINLHYAGEGQELGWHFDESSFSITLMIQRPEEGGEFEYVTRLRNSETGDMNYAGVDDVLDGKTAVKNLKADAGTLAMFRGRNAIHRVTPTEGTRDRMLVVFAYNNQPGIALSEASRKTFYGDA